MKQSHYGVGSAHGKIILMGEHSVVYGEPSIAIPFPATKVLVNVTAGTKKTHISCQFYTGLLEEMPELLESLKMAIQVTVNRLERTNVPLNIIITSSIPAERGMGSSAAVAVATTRALFDYFKVPLLQKELLEIVEIAEKIAHGNPSGLDALMTSSNTPYYFIKGQDLTPIHFNLDGTLIVADTGFTGQTKAAVTSVADKIKSAQGPSYQQMITDIGNLTDLGKKNIETNQLKDLGEKMTKIHHLLNNLGVSSQELDVLVETALKAGALGAKLTGGGRGGCMIALASDKAAAQKIEQSLLTAGAHQTWVLEMRSLS